MYPIIQQALRKASELPINSDRIPLLNSLITVLQMKVNSGERVYLNFICTHNSRRSQLAQVWMEVLAHEFNLPIRAVSSGTEVTALNERVVASLKRFGFVVDSDNPLDSNPFYSIQYDAYKEPILLYSKRVEDALPQSDSFIAVLTCSDAEQNCPFIPEAEARIPLRYEDPKVYDNTSSEAAKYDERSLQIASELLYIIQKITNHGNI